MSEPLARLCAYSAQCLERLEEESGQATGFRRVGSVSIAHSPDRMAELERLASVANGFGTTRVEVVGPEELGRLHPLVDLRNPTPVLGGVHIPADGVASPLDVLSAFIGAARRRGAICLEEVAVEEVIRREGRVGGVRARARTLDGASVPCSVAADVVVIAAGLWSRELGRRAGVSIPLMACEHYYAHTEKIADLPADLPVLRDHDIGAYVREDAGSLLVGAFEPRARPWLPEHIPEDFAFEGLPGDPERQLLPVLEAAAQRLPRLNEVGWRQLFCGPESFTPDDQFHLGEAPGLPGLFVACGLNSVGIQSAGGIGRAAGKTQRDAIQPPRLV